MKPNRSIELSQQFYRRLLRLYPQSYREHYESEMFHVFTDQCREAYQGRRGWGLLFLWLRTFVDVGKTVVIEHISHPNANMGLLEAMPNAPLPWKGVLLVLIPGLIFFISQIEQVISDKDWFFIAYYRAAFFLIVPVLLVWLFSRRFPVWGLIPLGLFFSVLGSHSPDYLIRKLTFIKYPESLTVFNINFQIGYFLVVLICLIFLFGVIWHAAHRREISLTAWRWLAVYGLLIVFQIIGTIYSHVIWQANWQGVDWQTVWSSTDMRLSVLQIPFWYSYGPLLFLSLVFIGILFARQHGGLSFLLLLGYLLPTIVFGRYGQWTDNIPFYLVVSAVLVYRFVVALVAPVWLVREASIPGRQRAASIPVAVAIACHVVLNVIVYMVSIAQIGFQPSPIDLVLSVCDQVIIAAGLGLAVALYLPKEKETTVASPPLVTVME